MRALGNREVSSSHGSVVDRVVEVCGRRAARASDCAHGYRENHDLRVDSNNSEGKYKIGITKRESVISRTVGTKAAGVKPR
jgi:hypothetical protein